VLGFEDSAQPTKKRTLAPCGRERGIGFKPYAIFSTLSPAPLPSMARG
jgi:hypothetical protein